jgi:uncharacterized protein YceK
MKHLLAILMVVVLSGCTTKYSHISADGSKLAMENYAITESATYGSDGKVLKSKKVMIPMYEGMIGKINTLVKPVMDLLLME